MDSRLNEGLGRAAHLVLLNEAHGSVDTSGELIIRGGRRRRMGDGRLLGADLRAEHASGSLPAASDDLEAKSGEIE